jgi:GTP-binding protein Era
MDAKESTAPAAEAKGSPGETTRSGFVCMVGPTNAGKSTLMNAVIGQKISIITPKPQTTRNRILGIHSVAERGQIVFVDTPGWHRPRGRLGERMVEVATRSLEDTDLALLVVDAQRDVESRETLHPANRSAARKVAETGLPAVAALNKIDLVRDKAKLLPVVEAYAETLGSEDLVPLSALERDGLDRLVDTLFARLPRSPMLYPKDMLSDQAERFLAAEIVREKVILATRQELPYSVAVQVEEWEEPRVEGKALRIGALIHVERKSQKGIVIGKGGERLKQIGTAARKELEATFGTKIFLQLYVRVEKNWTSDARRIERLGY